MIPAPGSENGMIDVRFRFESGRMAADIMIFYYNNKQRDLAKKIKKGERCFPFFMQVSDGILIAVDAKTLGKQTISRADWEGQSQNQGRNVALRRGSNYQPGPEESFA